MTCQPKNMDLTIFPFDNSWQKNLHQKTHIQYNPKKIYIPTNYTILGSYKEVECLV